MIVNIFAAFAVFAITVALNISVMIFGWGMEPRSWGWIIGVGVVGNLFFYMIGRHVLDEVGKATKK